MKWLLINLCLASSVVGLYNTEAKDVSDSEEIPVSTFFDETDLLGDIENAIIDECKTKDPEIADTLKDVLEDTRVCVLSKVISTMPLESYLTHFDNCSSKILTKTKSCLPSNKEYFANLLLDYVKGIIEIIYKHNDVLRSSTTAKCISTLEKEDLRKTIKTCIEQYERGELPDSKAVACKEFVPIHKCLTDPVKTSCDIRLSSFANDFLEMVTRICKP